MRQLNRREKILAIATLGLLVLCGVAVFIMTGDSRPGELLQSERERLLGEVQKRQQSLKAASQDAQRLVEWQRRSLPSDPVIARSSYQSWLHGLANRAGIRELSIRSESAESRRSAFARIPFSIHGRATLGELTAFLFEFYSSGQLQQIRKLALKPADKDRGLDVTMTIEGLSLPGANTKDRLPAEPGRRLRLAKVSDYREAIVGRNLFAAYTPPAPPPSSTPRRREPQFDFAKYVVVTGFTQTDGARQVWLQDRIAGKGKTWQLKEGEEFEINGARAAVVSIRGEDEVIVEFDGHRRRLRMGDNLHGGDEVKE